MTTKATTVAYTPSPEYTELQPTWIKLMDAYEGKGGFLNGSYLAAHPREYLDHSVQEGGKWVANPNPTQASPKLKARRKIARYENLAATLLDQLKAALFRKAPTRGFGKDASVPAEHPLRTFWQDADGGGQSIDAVISEAWTAAAVLGHMALLMDRVGDSDTLSDRGALYVRLYTALDIPDWILDDAGRLVALRLLEASPRESLDQPSVLLSQVRDVDADTFRLRRLDKNKMPAEAEGQPHGFGTVPAAMLFARRRIFGRGIGRSVLGDPQLYLDHFNLISEVRELLRNQTFGLLNVPIGPDGEIEREQSLLGQASGTANVVYSTDKIGYVSPDPANVQVYHEHLDRLTRLIYRLAVVGWDTDSKDAESAESRKLKREDLHQMLAGYAAECELTERRLAELVYRGTYGDQWKARWDADAPTVAYPDDFDVTGLLDEIEAVTAGLGLELGPRASKELKKRVIPRLLPNLSKDTAAEIEREIEAGDERPQAERDAERLEQQMTQRFGQTTVPVADAEVVQ